jgi:hypothetical protein
MIHLEIFTIRSLGKIKSLQGRTVLNDDDIVHLSKVFAALSILLSSFLRKYFYFLSEKCTTVVAIVPNNGALFHF